MTIHNECPKCGSSNIVPKQKIVSAEGSVDSRVIVRLREKTGTWRIKHHDHPIVARICGDCGYTELYTAKAKELSDVYQRLQQTQPERGLPDVDQGADTTSNRAFLILASVLLLIMLLGIIALILALGIPHG